jgi:hypothetical protein
MSSAIVSDPGTPLYNTITDTVGIVYLQTCSQKAHTLVVHSDICTSHLPTDQAPAARELSPWDRSPTSVHERWPHLKEPELNKKADLYHIIILIY